MKVRHNFFAYFSKIFTAFLVAVTLGACEKSCVECAEPVASTTHCFESGWIGDIKEDIIYGGPCGTYFRKSFEVDDSRGGGHCEAIGLVDPDNRNDCRVRVHLGKGVFENPLRCNVVVHKTQFEENHSLCKKAPEPEECIWETPVPVCGDGKCESGEGCNTCPKDCGSCYIPPVCPDGQELDYYIFCKTCSGSYEEKIQHELAACSFGEAKILVELQGANCKVDEGPCPSTKANMK